MHVAVRWSSISTCVLALDAACPRTLIFPNDALDVPDPPDEVQAKQHQ